MTQQTEGLASALRLIGGVRHPCIVKGTNCYVLRGSVPYELTEPYQSGFTVGRTSIRFDTEQEAVNALLALGITTFQMTDCSWYTDDAELDRKVDRIIETVRHNATRK